MRKVKTLPFWSLVEVFILKLSLEKHKHSTFSVLYITNFGINRKTWYKYCIIPEYITIPSWKVQYYCKNKDIFPTLNCPPLRKFAALYSVFYVFLSHTTVWGTSSRRDHSFSTFAKFFIKLTSLTPWNACVRVRIRV